MAKITQELAVVLPTLGKAVFSQPTGKDGPQKVELRPVLIKGERRYQVESFQNSKAFHQNFTDLPACSPGRRKIWRAVSARSC